jgi:hypothetical protein
VEDELIREFSQDLQTEDSKLMDSELRKGNTEKSHRINDGANYRESHEAEERGDDGNAPNFPDFQDRHWNPRSQGEPEMFPPKDRIKAKSPSYGQSVNPPSYR